MEGNSSNSADPLSPVREKALRLLDVRGRSRYELENRLTACGFSASIVGQVLDRLEDLGLLNDRLFAIERARSTGRIKGWGPRKIGQDLRSKGIDEAIIEAAVLQAYEPRTQTEVMSKILKKKYGIQGDHSQLEPKLRAKMHRFLISKGFVPQDVGEYLSSD